MWSFGVFLIEELNGRDYRIDVVSEVYSPLAVLFLIILFHLSPLYHLFTLVPSV